MGLTATETFNVLMGLVGEKGLECELYSELGRIIRITNAIDQGKMTPPPLPPDLNATQNPVEPLQSTISPEAGQSTTSIPPMPNE